MRLPAGAGAGDAGAAAGAEAGAAVAVVPLESQGLRLPATFAVTVFPRGDDFIGRRGMSTLLASFFATFGAGAASVLVVGAVSGAGAGAAAGAATGGGAAAGVGGAGSVTGAGAAGGAAFASGAGGGFAQATAVEPRRTARARKERMIELRALHMPSVQQSQVLEIPSLLCGPQGDK
jgi:hypothetical protein